MMPRQQSRAGFTLVELMVVIGIIAFLFSISFVAVMGAIGSAREKATKATVRKVDALLTKRTEGFERWANDRVEAARREGKLPQLLAGYVGRYPEPLAIVLWKKDEFRKAFPQTFAEAPLSAGLAAKPGVTLSPAQENGAVLYWMLTQGSSYGLEAVETDAFTSNERKDTNGDGYLEFVDGWGEPLRFYRWPTRLFRPAPAGSEGESQTINDPSGTPSYQFAIEAADPSNTNEWMRVPARDYLWSGLEAYAVRGPGTTISQEIDDPLARDPSDPTGVIAQAASTPAMCSNFERSYHTPETFHLPLIVSAGKDGILGLYEPAEKTNNHGRLAQPIPGARENLADNLTNRNLQAGGN